jgi:hypothetical protein
MSPAFTPNNTAEFFEGLDVSTERANVLDAHFTDQDLSSRQSFWLISLARFTLHEIRFTCL